jgi:hypothetical protein
MVTGGGPAGAAAAGLELAVGAGRDVAGLPAVQAETRTAMTTATAKRENLPSIAIMMDS